MRFRTLAVAASLAFGFGVALTPSAYAQGHGHGYGHGHEHGDHDDHDDHEPPGHAKRRVVTMDRATVVTREVLVQQGYEVVRVERVRDVQVVYFRRHHHGWGREPVEKMVIRPAPDRVIFESAPPKVLVDINVRLGL
ncbi:MAG TPA: hypothetical protein VFS44_05785 [Gemmatimonadaceae bacterium]|nr:hypothetical protein [Gemmatimonadaceae bacterium]